MNREISADEYDDLSVIIEADFRGMGRWLNDIQSLIKPYHPDEQLHFIRPIKHMLFEAIMWLKEEQRKKEKDRSDILRSAGIDPGTLDGFDWEKLRRDIEKGDY